MYDLHEMDERYILYSIKKSDVISDSFRQYLTLQIINRNNLVSMDKDILIFLIQYNNELSESYKEMLIYTIKEV